MKLFKKRWVLINKKTGELSYMPQPEYPQAEYPAGIPLRSDWDKFLARNKKD